MSDRGYYSVRLADADGNEVEPCGAFDLVGERWIDGARERIAKQFGERDLTVISAEPIEIEWHSYAPDGVDPDDVPSDRPLSLKHYFFDGGRIGCDVAGLEVMFTPDLLPEAVQRDPNEGPDEFGLVSESIGFARAKVRDRPDLAFDVDLDPLDEAHLVDRLSGEAAKLVARMRRSEEDNLRAEVGKGLEDAKAGRLSDRTVAEIAQGVSDSAHAAHLRRLADRADAGDTIPTSDMSCEGFKAFLSRP